jgi:hypothetical protein
MMINLNQRLGQFAPGKDSAARWWPCVAALGRSGFDREPHFDGHLVVQDLAALDVPSRFEHLEPADIVDRARSPGNGGLDRILDARGRGADEFDDLVDVVRHTNSRDQGSGWYTICELERRASERRPACREADRTDVTDLLRDGLRRN